MAEQSDLPQGTLDFLILTEAIGLILKAAGGSR